MGGISRRQFFASATVFCGGIGIVGCLGWTELDRDVGVHCAGDCHLIEGVDVSVFPKNTRVRIAFTDEWSRGNVRIEMYSEPDVDPDVAVAEEKNPVVELSLSPGSSEINYDRDDITHVQLYVEG